MQAGRTTLLTTTVAPRNVRRPLLAIAAVSMTLSVVAPAPAEACYNEHALHGDDGVKRIAQIEFHMRYEQYWLAHQAIPIKIGGFMDERLEDRVSDTVYLLDLRWHRTNAIEAVEWFRQRVHWSRSPQHLAWLAEALVATETGSAEAHGILRALEAKDVMPDARAYEVLSRVATGAERVRALQKCRTRAVVKAICGAAPRTT